MADQDRCDEIDADVRGVRARSARISLFLLHLLRRVGLWRSLPQVFSRISKLSLSNTTLTQSTHDVKHLHSHPCHFLIYLSLAIHITRMLRKTLTPTLSNYRWCEKDQKASAASMVETVPVVTELMWSTLWFEREAREFPNNFSHFRFFIVPLKSQEYLTRIENHSKISCSNGHSRL